MTRKSRSKALANETKVDPREETPRLSLVKVKVNDPDRKVSIEAILSAEQNASIIILLKEFKKFFIWHPNYM